MAFTPIHRALGIDPSDIDFGLIESAIAQGVEETDDLDWKQALPVQARHEEFAKDVAAMANSGGGTIVYGVAERGQGSSAAAKAASVATWGDSEERRLRQVAYNMIQPPVYGITFTPVVSEAGHTVVFLSVSPSPDSPHLVWANNRFNAPRRYGAQTVTMSEREIERAYRARFVQATESDRALDEYAHRALTGIDQTAAAWFTVTAIPVEPRPAYLGPVEKQAVTEILLASMQRNPFGSIDLQVPYVNVNPRRRYRMWRSTEQDQRTLAEVHDDGSLVYARSLRAARDQPKGHLHPMEIQGTFAYGVWLLRCVAKGLGIASRYRLRIDFHTEMPDDIYFLAVDEHYNGFQDPDVTGVMPGFVPVDTVLDPVADLRVVLDRLRALVGDVINQGGNERVGTTYIRESL